MNKRIWLIAILASMFGTVAAQADDSETNQMAKKIKAKVEREVRKYKKPLDGYCDFTIEMEHKGKFAYIERVRTNGDFKLCKVGKKALKKGMRFRYQEPEKFIRIQVVQK